MVSLGQPRCVGLLILANCVGSSLAWGKNSDYIQPMRISVPATGNKNDVTFQVAINAVRATRAEGVAGLKRTAALL